MKAKIRHLVAINIALLGATAVLAPNTAYARCPAYGKTTYIGCGAGQMCFKQVVDFIARGIHYQYSVYRQTFGGWVFYYSSKPVPC